MFSFLFFSLFLFYNLSLQMPSVIREACQKQVGLSTLVICFIYLFIAWYYNLMHFLNLREVLHNINFVANRQKLIALAQRYLTLWVCLGMWSYLMGAVFHMVVIKIWSFKLRTYAFRVLQIKFWHSSRFGTRQQKITAALSQHKWVVTSWYLCKKNILPQIVKACNSPLSFKFSVFVLNIT